MSAARQGTGQRVDPALLRALAAATPAQVAEAMRGMAARQQDLIGAHLARVRLAEFVRQAWPIVEPAHALDWGWHLDAICAHLEAVYRGEILKLVINVPPGHAKSLVVSVLFPAWVWTHSPQWRFLCASYADELSVRDSGRCRALIESEWYRAHFAGRWRLADDQNTKDHFRNTASGHRIATGVGGAGTGLRGHCVIIDDPLKVQDAFSQAERERASRWLSQTMSSRFDEMAAGRTVMIAQRVHREDPCGFVLSSPGWEHLCLPSEFEPHRRSVTYHLVGGVRREFWRDPREAEGELLFPARFPRAVLEVAKRPNELGHDGFAAQHQQRPAPKGGGMFKVAAWRFWREEGGEDHGAHRPTIDGAECYRGPARAVRVAQLEEVIVSVDATFKKTARGSFVAIHVWGRLGARRLLLDRVHDRMDFTETVAALLSVIRRWPQARRKLIEAKANGDAILSTLEREHAVTGLEPVNPGDASKEQRAHAAQPYQAAGNVELPDGAPWVAEYIAEHAAFPAGATNDDVDAQSQALLGFEHPEETADVWRRATA